MFQFNCPICELHFFAVPVEEADHLDWSARMRTIMGTAYCLQYMHDLNPPVPHSNLNSKAIFLTDDYAAKVCFLMCIYPSICHQETISTINESLNTCIVYNVEVNP